ncbi:TPA: tandem-95 repeat protein, partial [Vibrio vulnificus]|nr:tandem-95 repeat protein [Vibrio vulnificus]
TFLVKSIDGTQSTIKVTINGTNDRPTISGTSSGSVIEQGLNTAGTPDATGSLIATDLDKSDTITWAINQPQGQWGTLSIDQHGHWHYQLDNSTGGAADKLAAGEHQSESFWITATDSAGATIPHKIVIDVQGSNDKPIVSAWTQLPAGKEDQPVTIKASDLLTHVSDVDTRDILHVTNLQATHGSLTDNKDGTYTFTPDKDFNGEIRLTYDVVDGHGGSVSSQAKFALTAAPDNAVITDAQTNVDLRGVTEDRGYIDTHYQLHYDGRLNIQDPDAGEAQFDPNIGPQTYQGIGYDTKLGGHILLMRDGHYTYTLDNRNIQNLAQGEVKHDSAVIRSADGTTHTIELTVHGTNDAPVINAQSHSVTEDGQLLTGQMQGHDIDHGATLTYSIAQAVDGLTFNPDGSYSFDPSHPSYQSLVQGQTQTLTVPVTVTDEHGASATQNLEIMVTGSNDGAQISGTDTGDVYESAYTDRSPDYQRGNISHLWNDHIHTSGKLDIVDSDAGEAHFDNNAPAYQYFGQYGRLILQPDGNWYYRVDVGDSAIGRKIDALNTGENLTDTITIRSADGTTHDVVITIHGDNDSPFASGEVQLNSGKEDNAQTITDAQLLANSMDVDTSDAGKLHVDNLQVDHGSIRDNQDGTYTFTPEKDYNGQVHFTYDVKDAHSGVTHTGATMTLAPVGDAATIIGTDTGSITEDRHVFPDSMHHIQVTGSLSVSDPDAGEDHFRASGAFGYEKAISDPFQGEMHIDRYGNWDYVLANGNPALQALKQGETKDVIYEVYSADGTPHRITITVTGTNDAPTVSSSVTLAAGKEDTAVTLQASDLLAHASDIDHNAQLSIHNLSADHGQIVDNHDGTFRFIPDKDYNGPVQFSYQVQDEHGASVAQTASMNLAAVNDAAQISGRDTGSVTEDLQPHAPVQGNYAYKLEAHGTLQAIDPDAGESGFEFKTLISAAMHPEWAPYTSPLGGQLAIDPKGNWNYYIDNRKPEIQQLGEGETLTDTVTIHSKDGTTHDIVITIHGTNDAPTVSSEVQLNSGKEDTVQTITTADLLAHATDIDNNDQGQLTITNLIANHGTIKDNQDGTYTFTPDRDYNGQVHFTYDVKDAHGGVTQTGATLALAAVDDRTVISGVSQGASTEDVGTPMATHVNIMDAVDWQALQITDVDNANTQVTVEFAGQRYTWDLGRDLDIMTPYGKFQFHTITSGPHIGEHAWSYIGDNNNIHVQELKHGESLTESIKLIATDGTEFPISVTVNGTEDGVVIDSKSELGHVIEDSQTAVSGSVTAHDTDLHDTVSWTQTPTGGVPGHYGTFHLSSDGQWHYDLDQSKAEQLGDGDEYWEHFTVEAISTDGSRVSKSVSIVVHGSNDAPTVSGEVTLPSGKEDSSIHITQTQLIANATDTDLNDRGWLHAQNLTADHGSITSNSDGSFTFKPDPNYHGAVHFSYDIADRHGGVTHTGASMTLTPENDPSVLVGTGQATLTEDHTQGSSSTLWSGWLQLDIQDPDGPSDGKIVGIEVNGVVHQVPANFALTLRTHLGYFSTTHSTDGHNKWSYSADNSNPEIQGLKAGEQLHESMTLITADGTRIPITATINGAEDHVVIDTPVATLASLGTAIEDTTTRIVGQLQAHDVDIHDSVSYVQTSLGGQYGTFHLDSNGAWHYDLDHSRADHLAAGEMKAEGFDITATSSDGSQVSQHIELYVQGSNDAPQVTEVNQGKAPLGSHSIDEDGPSSAQGQILITDVDHSDQHSVVVDAHNQPQYGHVSYDTQTNTWTYVLDNANPTVNALNSGDDLTDKFSLIVDDGHGGIATKEIEMTIHGHSDTPPTPTLVAPARITGSAGHQDLHASLGIPPLIHQAVPHMQTGWGILTGGGHVVSSLQGQFGTLHVNAQTGELTYDYQSSSGVIKTHTGGSYGSGTDETDSFILTLAGTQNSQVSVHLHLHSQSVHGASGHHIDQTTLTGIDVSPLNAPPPPPPVASDEISPITPENDNVEVAGVDVYLHALGITSLTDQDAHDTQQQSPQDLDIVLSDPAHDPNSLNPEVGNHQIDITEQPDHDLDDINPDDHHNHNDPTSFIDPN